MAFTNRFIQLVHINRRAYEDMVIYASRYASEFIDPDDQREVYGILIGNVNQSKAIVNIKQAIGIVVGKRTGVEFESKQYVDLSNIDESIWKKSVEYTQGDFICGWWHTHPGFGFFYSHTDILNHVGFQAANPFAIGIIYDYTQRKLELNDSGIEVLTLDKPEPLHCTTETVNFEIEELSQALTTLTPSLKEKVKQVAQARKMILSIQENLEKKRLAQVQRNYGLLLLKKHEEKKSKAELKEMSEEDRWLYEWNESDINKKYIIPVFRKNIEKKIAEYKVHKDKRGTGQKQLEEQLMKPKALIEEIYREFNDILEKIQPVRRWLDAEERLILSNFNHKLTQYIKILNALITKVYYLLPHDTDLNKKLFDEQVLNSILYGNEEESMLDTKEISSQPVITQAPTTNVSQVGSEFVSKTVSSSAPESSPKATPAHKPMKILDIKPEQTVDEGWSDSEELFNAPLPLNASNSKKEVEFVQKPVSTQGSTPELHSKLQSTTEPPIKISKISKSSAKALPKATEPSPPITSESVVKVNVIKPTNIQLKPITIEDTEKKFEISLDEIFEKEHQKTVKPPKNKDEGW